MTTVSSSSAANPNFIASPTMATPRPAFQTIPPNISMLPTANGSGDPSPHILKAVSPVNGNAAGGTSRGSSRNGIPEDRNMLAAQAHADLVSMTTESPAPSEGRMTPLASESGVLSQTSSGLSDLPPPSPPSTTISSISHPSQVSHNPSFNSLPVPQAEIGLSSLSTERQLREAALGKDRMFLLLLSREIEAFITRVAGGDTSTVVIPQGTISSSALAAMGPAITVTTVTTSKYQKMLVYKAAEWYGLRGVAGPDNTIIVGVIGQLEDRSPSLRFSEIAPKPPSPKQSFKIMQRNSNNDVNGTSRSSSTTGEDSETTTRRKTMQEREAEYALARERIYGKNAPEDDTSSTSGRPSDPNTRPQAFDPLQSGHGPPSTSKPPRPLVEPVYASLYNTSNAPAESSQVPAQPSPSISPTDQIYDYQISMMPNQSSWPQMQMQQPTYQYRNPAQMNPGQFPMYPQNSQNPYQVQPQYQGNVNPYGPQAYGNGLGWQNYQTGPSPMRSMSGPASMTPTPGQNNMNPNMAWYNGNGMPMMPNQPMPMIQQGVQYPAPVPYGPQVQPYQQYGSPYGHLAHPTPVRPNPRSQEVGSSSTTSEISSRSYQDMSRPHSRGSTTSTRSATSSVRMGYMYPVGVGMPGPTPMTGYRQKGMKGQMFTNMNSNLGPGDRRSTRGHSPSSNTTESSRSSRRATSIALQPPAPGQHQLPQRPDWAANNIPYHPSAIPMLAHRASSGSNNSISEFPPLARNGTNAEPMQVERAKLVNKSPTTVWNGVNARPAHSGAPIPAVLPQVVTALNGNGNGATSQLTPTTAKADGLVNDSSIGDNNHEETSGSPQIPRRVPSTHNGTGINDSQSIATAPELSPLSVPTQPMSVETSAVPHIPNGNGNGEVPNHDFATEDSSKADLRSPEEVIEAKLAALSVTSGISIGPPPNRPVTSYAKIVRKD